MADSTRRTVETDWGNANPTGVIAPDQSTQDNGYAAVKPPYQEHNWLFQLATSMLQSAEKNGFMEWRSTTEYNQYGLTFGSDGLVYQSQVASNTGNDPVTDGGTNWIAWPNEIAKSYAMQYSGVEVYNGSAPTSFTDLDLSSEVGANRAFVHLRVSGNTTHFFRTNGETQGVADSNDNPGGTTLARISGGNIAYVSLITDESGIIEWYATGTATSTITIQSYQVLQ